MVQIYGRNALASIGVEAQNPAGILRLQHFNERLLRDVHVADGLHALLALFLFLEELAFARDVTAPCSVIAILQMEWRQPP